MKPGRCATTATSVTARTSRQPVNQRCVTVPSTVSASRGCTSEEASRALEVSPHVLEPRRRGEPGKTNGVRRSAAVLADDDLGDALGLDRVGVVDLVPVQEYDDVGVLLDRA